MRFKAKLGNDKLSAFQGVVSALEKVAPKSILLLTAEDLRFCMTDSANTDGLSAFAQLNPEELFMDWRIESQTNNIILLEVQLQNILDALNSAKKAPQCQIKLAKRSGQACLCLETRALEIDVLHEIPVTLIRASDAAYYNPPPVDRPQVQLTLPMGRGLKNIVDRVKSLSKHLYLKATMAGSLDVRVANDQVEIRSFFTELQPSFENLDDEDEEDIMQGKAYVKLESKPFSTALQCTPIATNSLICLEENHTVVVHNQLNGGTITFYLAVQNIDDAMDWDGEE